MAFVRGSKFRHIFGKPLKKDQCYDGIRITRTSWESTYCAVNPKYVAICTEATNGSAFLVLPLAKVGRLATETPLVSGHKGPVFDLAWCPHNDDVIASASDDCTVKVWQIPENGLTETLTEPAVTLSGHQRRVTLIVWHPSAMNVLISASSDLSLITWNVGTGEAMLQITLPEQVYSLSFNEDGSRFVCTCKDKNLRVIDSHTGDILTEGKGHAGSKPAQAVYTKEGRIVTTGFSRMSERQYALWDENDFSSSIVTEEIDSSNGVQFIFYDPDVSLFYLVGKGDSVIRYYEITNDPPMIHYLSTYQSNAPQRGMGYMPKRAMNVMSNEIARFYKLHNNGLCEVIPFTVPRKSELFQSDIFPDTASDTPAISADEFFSGMNAKPVLLNLEKSSNSSSRKEPLKVARKSNVLDKLPAKSQTSISNTEAAAAASLPASQSGSLGGVDVQELVKGLSELKATVKAQEERIAQLEGKIASLEAAHHTDEEEDQVA